MHYLGIDIGSSYTKYAVIDSDNKLLYSNILKTLSRNKEEKGKVFFDSLMEELKFHFENNEQYRNFCQNKNFDPFNSPIFLSVIGMNNRNNSSTSSVS